MLLPMFRSRIVHLIPIVLAAAAPALAQTDPQAATPAATPTPQATPVPIPPAPVIVLPTSVPTPAPASAATPTPRPSSQPTPSPSVSPTPSASRSPEPTRAPAAQPPTTAIPEPSPSLSPATVVSPMPSPATAPAVSAGGIAWWWIAGLLVVAVAAVAVLLRRRGLAGQRGEERGDVTVAAPTPLPVDETPLPVKDTPAKPRLTLDLRPVRAGLNLLSATVEAELSLTNVGDAPAAWVAVHTVLTSARSGDDPAVARLYAEPPPRPAVPPFALAAGETRTVRLVAALPRADIVPMTAAGRPMFVPMLALNCLFRDGEGAEGQVTQSFVIGVERSDSAKLAPFWLDQPPRTTDQVAARRHGFGLAR